MVIVLGIKYNTNKEPKHSQCTITIHLSLPTLPSPPTLTLFSFSLPPILHLFLSQYKPCISRQTKWGRCSRKWNAIAQSVESLDCLWCRSEAGVHKKRELSMGRQDEAKLWRALFVKLMSLHMRGDRNHLKFLSRRMKLSYLGFKKSLYWLWGTWTGAEILKAGRPTKGDEDLDGWVFSSFK